MYSSPNTCKPSFESSVHRLFEYPQNYPLVQQEHEDLRDVEEVKDFEEVRDVEEVTKIRKKKTIKEIRAIKEIREITQPIDYNKYYGCIGEILKINVHLNITSPNKPHKIIKRNKIFAALCDSSDDDEYTFSEDALSKSINYETKRVKVYDPSSVIEHKEDSDI